MDELRTGRFRAVLDVFYQEPLAFDHELRSLNNVICTPHSAGTSQYWRRKQADYVIEDMKRFFCARDALLCNQQAAIRSIDAKIIQQRCFIILLVTKHLC